MYKKQFEIRWSDVDANGHLANSAYTNFMSHARMSFFTDHGFAFSELKRHDIGPVVFYEHTYYFKESFLGESIIVSIEISGLSEDMMFFRFEHNFYNLEGKHLAFCEMQGAWIDLNKRKLTTLPNHLRVLAEKFPKTKDFKILTKADMRKGNIKPKDIIL